MSDLIFPSIEPTLKVAIVGPAAQFMAEYLGLKSTELNESDVAIFLLSAVSGVDEKTKEMWDQARELYIPSLVLVTDLETSETDFEDMAAIGGRLLDPLINPFLVIYEDDGQAAALIDLDSLNLVDYSDGKRIVRDSDPEHKLLVFEFRKEYLDAIEEFGPNSFEAALTFPALPIFVERNIGKYEVLEYLKKLPSRS